ncbi:MAG: hypothetical protein H7196_00985 [candidate division SR1 bacterium]|nr:hypothetical protein [candidate division SR1 bacterium]
MSRPKTVRGIFATIGNELKQTIKSVASSKPLFYKLGVVIGFAARSIGNITQASFIALESKNKKSERIAKIRNFDRAEQAKKAKLENRRRYPYGQPKPKVYYMTEAEKKAIANTQAQFIQDQREEADRKEKILIRLSPKPYRPANHGEYVHEFNCIHVGCEGSGYFEVADGNLQDLRRKFGNDPVNCYPCKAWMYNTQLNDYILERCEVCSNLVNVKTEVWIGYHKFKGKPQLTLFCDICELNRKKAAQADRDRQITLSYRGDREGIRKFGMEHEDPDVRDEAKRLQIQSKFAKCIPIAYADLVDISESTYHFYHNYPVSNGKKGMESQYAHLRHHIDGSNGKTPSVADFANVMKLLDYAYGIAQINDPTRTIDSDEDKENAIVKVDLETGIKLVFLKTSDKWYLKTAFRMDDSEGGVYSDRESAVRFANQILAKKTSQYADPRSK